MTAERRLKIKKWMGSYNGADNSRIAYAQETAEEGESKHRDRGDCRVEDRG